MTVAVLGAGGSTFWAALYPSPTEREGEVTATEATQGTEFPMGPRYAVYDSVFMQNRNALLRYLELLCASDALRLLSFCVMTNKDP